MTRIDYLDVDPTLAGQNFCCLSFVSPDSEVEKRELFMVEKFVESLKERFQIPDDVSITDLYKQFKYDQELAITEEFTAKNPGKSSVRGLKVRGVFSTIEEAKSRAKSLHDIDPDFHVFVAQVGYWLPWDPSPHMVGEEVYAEERLNELVSKYKENLRNTEAVWNRETQARMEKARQEGMRTVDAPETDEAGPSSVPPAEISVTELGEALQEPETRESA